MTFQVEKWASSIVRGNKIKVVLPDNYLALCIEQIDVEGPEAGWTS